MSVDLLADQLKAGLDAPICLTWELTYACNLQCVHCLSSSGQRDPHELTTAEAKAVIDELARRMARPPGLSGPTGASATPGATGGATPTPGAGLASDTGPLQWIRASVGSTLKLIPVDEILFLRSDEKYTLVVTGEGEALIRTPIRELIERLDPQRFVQVHRSVVVNLHAISHVTRGPNETADLHLKARPDVLPVSRSYLHLFRQM